MKYRILEISDGYGTKYQPQFKRLGLWWTGYWDEIDGELNFSSLQDALSCLKRMTAPYMEKVVYKADK